MAEHHPVIHHDFVYPVSPQDYPEGPQFHAGHLVEGHAGWRTFRPVVKLESCVGCGRCFLLCPDGAIYREGKKVAVNLDFCKGCGVCHHHCPAGAIDWVLEGEDAAR